MTENEAIKRVEEFGLHHAIGDLPYSTLTVKAFEMAIEALQEIQQYRAIGTVEECREAREKQRVKKIIHNPDGRVDEDWLCPSCGRFCSPYFKHCQHCGQSVKVGDAP